MITKPRIRLSRIALVCLLLGVSFNALGAGRDDVIINPEIGWSLPTEIGSWRTRVQQVFDPVQRALVRRAYVVWDARPSRNLDFVWIADSPATERDGELNGEGRLLWRLKEKPAYDPTSIVAEFRGTMKDGRAEGHGSYREVEGITYQGEWKNGVMQGRGVLTLPSGDEYRGELQGGKASGVGRYVDTTGEVFEGNFVDGRREGRGSTTLPNGLMYRSTWIQGTETEESRSVRLAQLGSQQSTSGPEDVRVGITIDRTRSRDGDLKYVASSAGSLLQVRPDNKRLMDLWKGGGEIQLKPEEEGDEEAEYGVFSLVRGQLFPLTFVLEVQNRSSTPIQITGAYVSVASSMSDLQPAIQLRRRLQGCMGAVYSPTFQLENFGWGAAEQANMRLAFTGPNQTARPTSFDHSKDVGNIAKITEVTLEPELRSAGVNIRTLKASGERGFACRKAPAQCLQDLRASGVFGSLAARTFLNGNDIFVGAAGSLNYAWRDSAGAAKTNASPFRVELPLGHLRVEGECGEGGQREAIAAKPLTLRLDQSNYRLPVAFRSQVPAGRIARFTLPLKADKSSEHDFTIVLQLADGREISSRRINLLYFLPRWFHGS